MTLASAAIVISLRDVIKGKCALSLFEMWWEKLTLTFDLGHKHTAQYNSISHNRIYNTTITMWMGQLKSEEKRRNCRGMWADGNSISRCVFNFIRLSGLLLLKYFRFLFGATLKEKYLCISQVAYQHNSWHSDW